METMLEKLAQLNGLNEEDLTKEKTNEQRIAELESALDALLRGDTE